MTLREILKEMKWILYDLNVFLLEARDNHIETLYYQMTYLYDGYFSLISPFYYFMIIAFFISSYVWIKAINDKPSSITLFKATGLYWVYLAGYFVVCHILPLFLELIVGTKAV